MKNGWNKPLKLRWEFHFPELISEIKKQINMSFARPTGKLRNSFSLGNIRKIRNGTSEGVEINNSLPYAAIQNYGGDIPRRYPTNAKALHWMMGGTDVFAKSAAGFHINGQNYIEKAVDRWAFGSIDVEWDK
jgi:hypothetical protein